MGEIPHRDQLRFFAKVADMGSEGCWLWQGATTRGYGRFYAQRRGWQAHRVSYELLRGPIPDGLVIDHLCRNHGCVNPDHLEPVTNRENICRGDMTSWRARFANKTHCVNGHPYVGANIYISATTGRRACAVCRRLAVRRHRARKI